jgi:hypothetical protein
MNIFNGNQCIGILFQALFNAIVRSMGYNYSGEYTKNKENAKEDCNKYNKKHFRQFSKIEVIQLYIK